MLRIAILQPDPRAAARLADALRSTYELRSYRSWEKLYSHAPKAPWACCIVDIYPPEGPVSPTQLGDLRRQRPDLAIVVYSDFADREPDLFEVGRQQIDAVILAGLEDSPSAIQATISRSLASPAAGVVEGALEGRLAALGIAVVRWSMEHSFERPSVDELSEGMGMSRSQLTRELNRRGLPPPRALLLWGRGYSRRPDCFREGPQRSKASPTPWGIPRVRASTGRSTNTWDGLREPYPHGAEWRGCLSRS